MATTTILGKEITAFSASYATTASYALSSAGGGAAFPYTGSAQITGSLGVTGSFNQGSASLATGLFAHAQGYLTTASGDYSHAEGYNTRASGIYSHAEGSSTIATGPGTHAEGSSTTALGAYSHAEGNYTTTTGSYSHAEGYTTIAIGEGSHAEGNNTVASGAYQHVQGQYNISSSAQSAFILGNGTGNGALRSNLIFASGSQVQVTGSVISTAGFTGSLLGTASIATTAASASSILAASGPAGTYSIPWMSQKTAGIATYFQGDTVLQYETATGRVSATTFNGALTGNATSATSASTHTVTTNALHYPVFVDANNASPTTEKLGTVGNLTYNPSIGSLNATSITGSLRGTASYATVASQSGYTIQMVLATTGSNLAASTTYRMGAPVRNQLLTTGGINKIYVPRPGKVRYVSVFVRTNGTLASAGTSTFQLNRSNVLGEIIGTSTGPGSTATVTVESTAVSMSVSQGDYLDIGFTTPAWATLPTAVEANAIIYIENNI